VLSELAAVLQWLRLYRTLPQDRLRVFSCSSREEMNEQLVRVNQGRVSTSVTAAQFLHERRISSPGVVWGAPADEPPRNERATSIAVVAEPPPGESDREARPLDERRSNAGRVAIMTCRTGSRCPPRRHKSWPGYSCWRESSRETSSRKLERAASGNRRAGVLLDPARLRSAPSRKNLREAQAT
jgi:hypothetical protein